MGQDGPYQNRVLGKAVLACLARERRDERLDAGTLFKKKKRFNYPDINATTEERGRGDHDTCWRNSGCWSVN